MNSRRILVVLLVTMIAIAVILTVHGTRVPSDSDGSGRPSSRSETTAAFEHVRELPSDRAEAKALNDTCTKTESHKSTIESKNSDAPGWGAQICKVDPSNVPIGDRSEQTDHKKVRWDRNLMIGNGFSQSGANADQVFVRNGVELDEVKRLLGFTDKDMKQVPSASSRGPYRVRTESGLCLIEFCDSGSVVTDKKQPTVNVQVQLYRK